MLHLAIIVYMIMRFKRMLQPWGECLLLGISLFEIWYILQYVASIIITVINLFTFIPISDSFFTQSNLAEAIKMSL